MNGSMSSSSHTKHIKARYYFVKVKVEEGEVDIRYCPTKKMWSDILNKPQQGSPFSKDRAMIMNVPVNYYDRVKFLKMNPGLLPKGKKMTGEPRESTDPALPVGVCYETSAIMTNRGFCGIRNSPGVTGTP